MSSDHTQPETAWEKSQERERARARRRRLHLHQQATLAAARGRHELAKRYRGDSAAIHAEWRS